MYRYLAGRSSESDPERESSLRAVAGEPNARDSLTSWPRVDGLETLLSQGAVADVSSRLPHHHIGRITLFLRDH